MVWNGVKFPDRITDAVKRSVLQNAIAGKPVRRRSSAMRLSRNTSIGETPFCETPYRTDSVRFFNFISNRVQILENSFCVKSGFLCLRTFFICVRKGYKKRSAGRRERFLAVTASSPRACRKGLLYLNAKDHRCQRFLTKSRDILLCVVFRQSRALVYCS